MNQVQKAIYNVLSKEKTSSNELRRQVEKMLGEELNNQTYYRALAAMVRGEVAIKEEVMQNGVKHQYYSLTDSHDLYTKIAEDYPKYRKVFSSSFHALRQVYPRLVPAERDRLTTMHVSALALCEFELRFFEKYLPDNFQLLKEYQLVKSLSGDFAAFMHERIVKHDDDPMRGPLNATLQAFRALASIKRVSVKDKPRSSRKTKPKRKKG